MKIVTYGTNKNSLNESLKRDPQNLPSVDEIKEDIKKNYKNKDLVKKLIKYIDDNNVSSSDLLDWFYEKDEVETKAKGIAGKIKIKVHALIKEKLDNFFDERRLKKEDKINLYKDIKDKVIKINRSEEAEHIVSIIKDKIKKERDKGNEIGEVEFLLKNFYEKDPKTEEYVIVSRKVRDFLDKYDAEKIANIQKEKIDEIPKRDRAFLEGLNVDVTIKNYKKIKPDKEEDVKVGENGGWFYDINAKLINSDGTVANYNVGDLFWLGTYNQKIKFAFYLLTTEFEKNGLSKKFQEDEINVIEDEFSEYPWDEKAKEEIIKKLDKMVKQSNKTYGNILVAFAVGNKVISKKDINNVSQEEIYNKCLDYYANSYNQLYPQMSIYLTDKKGKDWYSKNQEEYDEYFNSTKWAIAYLREDKANIDKVIGWYSQANGFENRDFEVDDMTYDLIQMDKDLLEDIDFIE